MSDKENRWRDLALNLIYEVDYDRGRACDPEVYAEIGEDPDDDITVNKVVIFLKNHVTLNI